MLIWKGASALDGTPVKLILAESKSQNVKTGPMVQSYILRDTPDAKPSAHVKDGTDRAICGNCPFAGGNGCYVDVAKSVNSTFRAHATRELATLAEIKKLVQGRMLRIGAYGDPAAVPFGVWQALVNMGVTGWTGYTHQWRECDERFGRLVMASVEDVDGMVQAHAMGYRTFRVAKGTEGAVKGTEVPCLNTTKGTSCNNCGLCNGNPRGLPEAKLPKSIVIAAHGVKVKRALANVK